MAKGPTFDSITAAFASASKLNANFAAITTSFDNTISRDGSTPNTMAADLDMDSNDILNVSALDANTIILNGTAITASVDIAPVAEVRDLDTRTIVAATSINVGFNFIRTSGYSSVGDGGGALYKRGSEPSHALKVQSNDGAWWELVAENGAINVLQAGADPTNTSDSITAFRACVDFARYNVADEQSAGGNGPTIIVPQGVYKWSDTLEPRTAITMIGTSRGMDGNVGTIIEVAIDKTGLILPKHDTLGAGKEDPNDPLTKGANGSFIQGLQFRSLGGTDPLKHGIHVRVTSVMLSHIEVRNFPGDGFHTRASTGGGQPDDLFGLANLWRYEHCSAFGNQQHGFFWEGSDVNAGVSMGLSAVQNGRWGLWDKAFLSNTHIAAHMQGNGHATAGENAANVETSVVVHSSSRWAVMPGQATAASTTTPGTNAAIWHELISGGQTPTAQAPAWSNGNTYVVGGGYYFSGNGVKVGLSCYAEDDNWSVVEGTSVLRDGFNANIHTISGGTRVKGSETLRGGHVFHNENSAIDLATVKIMPPGDTALALGFFYAGGPNTGLGFRWDDTKKMLRALGTSSASSWPIEFLTDDSTTQAGRGSGKEPGQGNLIFPNGYFVGLNVNARWVGSGDAAPVSGDYASGDVLTNRAAATGGVVAWKCTVTGSPGTWVEIRGLADQQSAIADPTGGGTVDTESRTAIAAINVVLETLGFIAT